MKHTTVIPIQPLAIADGSTIANAIQNVDTDTLPVIEMFDGIEGEGIDIGEHRILLRVGGCRVSCTGCDSAHTWGLKTSKLYAMRKLTDELLALASRTQVGTVAITGGEPLHYPEQLIALASHLKPHGIRTWLETSGLILDEQVFKHFDFLSMDVKTPSSGPACFGDKALSKFISFFEDKNFTVGQFKMIVTNETDADWIIHNFDRWVYDQTPFNNPVIITPACGPLLKGQSVEERLSLIHDRVLMCQKKFAGSNVRIIVQQHALLGMR